jgi:cation transport ATPase
MNEQKLLQQRMMQQQAMQQQAMQQQAMQQQKQQQQPSSEKNTVPVKQEGFMNKFSVKSLSLLGVLFALFYVFSSSQLESVVTKIPYLSNQLLNLAVRGLLFVVVYFVLDKFVL